MAEVNNRVAIPKVAKGDPFTAVSYNGIIDAISELQEGSPVIHPFRMALAKTKSTGIPANNKAFVYRRTPKSTGWEDDTNAEIEAWNQHPTSAVGNSKIIIIAQINSRWVVVTEFC